MYNIFKKNNNILYIHANLLIPVDCYNEFIFLWEPTSDKKIKEIKELLLNKPVIVWDHFLKRYISKTIKNIVIVYAKYFDIIFVYKDGSKQEINTHHIYPLDLRYLNGTKSTKYKIERQIGFDLPYSYIPNILNQTWNIKNHKQFTLDERNQIKEIILTHSKLDPYKIPKDVLFFIISMIFKFEEIVYDPKYIDNIFKFVREKDENENYLNIFLYKN